MTAPGPATGQVFEVNFTAGVLTDVSTYVDFSQPAAIHQGRSSRYDDIQPGTLVLTLTNPDGRWTPDNPLSPYYPTWKEGIGVRWSVTKTGPGTVVRFRGRITRITPDMRGGVVNWSTVTVEAVDTLGRLARRQLACDFVERWKATASTDAVDLWPFDETTVNPTTLRNLTGAGVASIVLPVSRVGAVTMTQPDGIILDSCVQVTATGAVGPVVQLVPSVPAGTVADIVVPFRTADRTFAGGADRWVVFGRTVTGAVLWSLRLKDNAGQTDLNLYDGAGTFLATAYFGFAPGAGSTDPGDDQWFVFRLGYSAGTFCQLARAADRVDIASFTTAGFDVRQTALVVLGGALPYATPGKQGLCISGQFGAVAVADVFPGHVDYVGPNATEPPATRVDDLRYYTGTTAAVTGSDPGQVTLARLTGRSAFDAFAELVRTTGGVARPDYTGIDRWGYAASSAVRSTTVALTVDAITDLDASDGFPWRRGVDTRPTRVTASWPGGSVTVVGDETLQQLDGSVETCAADETGAASVASARINTSGMLSVQQLVIDLAHAETNLWSAVMALKLGDRVRVSGLPTAMYGRSYADVYVLGWDESYDQQTARWVLDTEPADDPVEGVVDDATDSRTSADTGTQTVTSGTAVGVTGNGTMVVTTAAGPVLSSAAGDYGQDFNWNGERVTVTTAPGGASPQTLTTTARGVAPSVARVHSAGEAITPWHEATATF
jgi:hypothetical protein